MDNSSISDPQYWSNLLWTHFIPFAQSKTPFYLSVDERLLNCLLGVTPDNKKLFSDNIDSFHLMCKKLFNIDKCQASLKQSVFEKVSEKNYSCAICLASQQVLVVEKMLRDEKYSENSYFPRYRELLGVTGGNQNSNPLTTKSFTKIWGVLANEIKFFSETDGTVTFSSGKTRKELNRNFPLSQALLTTQDLIKLKKKFVDNKLEAADPDLVLRFILKNKNILGKRGRQIILNSSPYKKQNLSDQFKTFLSLDYDYALLEQSHSSKGKEKVVAFLDQESSLKDKLSFYLWCGEDEYIQDDSLLVKKVTEKIGARDIVLIADKDRYVELVSDLVNQNSNVIVVLTAFKNFSDWENKLQEHSESRQDNYELISSNLPKKFCSIILSGLTDRDIENIFGSIYTKKKYTLSGGITVDARSKIYLKSYPPNGLLSDNERLPGDCKIKINGCETDIQSFFSHLDRFENEAFEIEVNSSKINFMFLKQGIKNEDREYGYSINEGRLSPYSELVEGKMEGLVGVIFRGADYGQHKGDNYYSDIQILIGIIDSSQKDLALNTKEISSLVNYVSKLELNPILKKFVIKKIKMLKTIKPNSKILDFLRER